ncbi:glycosyl transferase domain-containing protein, family 2 [Gottschalkia acidurici 9a]|uniref:Hyaluronan synthase n=1 Tax=Gottschalkia acidurici (strain ATCC 7906 / DSM 604 / BCRC 14475 / CIP 104303 / KCTC 5404 / NCIMB 10678 / 9a) TaxID=1128398 RepID=K0B0P6_GOTA9|nr:glycosyltransferase [Gottschalkia acidurici]AFS79099.1 glycosyl transferase domain-containing protein, family 2 [Gottschalkia acidurici 9a]
MFFYKRNSRRNNDEKYKDILLKTKDDRRLLSHVPDNTKRRSNIDRRGKDIGDFEKNISSFIKNKQSGTRYKVNYDIDVICNMKGKETKFSCSSIDISMTGILIQLRKREHLNSIKDAETVFLKFKIKPGTMPEGSEMKVNISANIARIEELLDEEILCGMVFDEELSTYISRKRGKYMIMTSSSLLFFITVFIILMRAESIVYFKFNKWLYLYSIIAAVFLLSRYFVGIFYRQVPIDPDFTPGVTILIPCFNEEEWIQRTILSCINQDYPIDKLEVIVIDDFSTDKSVEKIKEVMNILYNEAEQFDVKNRLKYILMEKNGGKREALSLGALKAKHDLVVFVDSDSFLDPYAIRNLVQPFKDPKMGGVSGRTDVANTYTNILTKMQSVRYYIAFRIIKAAESYFDAVTCLSGPLACYKKSIILENREAWLNQKFLGHRATFGDDRAMTNFVLKKHRTAYQDSAICSTIVPNKQSVFLKQQMRWKRSWLRESLIASKYMWKKEPFAALTFYMGVLVPIAAPIIVIYNLVYVPIMYRIFPKTFIIGLLLMSMLMSMTQLFLRKSTTWIFGMVFCFYYEAVLLWQMPIAWVTFWKSTWGTRMTPSDVKAQEKIDKRRKRHLKKSTGEGDI